jgi:hypothetical protein
MSRYYRSKTGKVVHYPYCTRVTQNARPWRWADDKSDALIAMHMAEKGINPCRLCRPPLWPMRAYLRVVNGD